MPKRLLLFSDGTGNSSAKAEKTNVWRLFQAVDLRDGSQKAYYDDGVGTSSNKYLAALGGAFGWGLKRNVIDLYKFVCRNYEDGDEICGFGFSRGAFTIRLLVGLIHFEGLVRPSSEEELDRLARAAYRHYRSERFHSFSPLVILMRGLRDAALRCYDALRQRAPYSPAWNTADVKIQFLGLWDTVEAYEVPIEALKKAIDLAIWPLVFADLKLSTNVVAARHALSLDDQRQTFHPLLWDEAGEDQMVAKGDVPPGRLLQVWFAGVHSNVGGGYPEDRLSLVPLHWIMSEASHAGVVLLPDAVDRVVMEKSACARLYDSRAGVATLYRYAPRRLERWRKVDGSAILPIIDGSVIRRMVDGQDYYVPVPLPRNFRVLAPSGICKTIVQGVLQPTAPLQTVPLMGMTSAALRAEEAATWSACTALSNPPPGALAIVADTIWWRKLTYLLTLLFGALLLLMPTFASNLPEWAGSNSDELIRRGLQGLSYLLPNVSTLWTRAFSMAPDAFALLAAGLGASLYMSGRLKTRIGDRARLAWHRQFQPKYLAWQRQSERNGRNVTLVIGLLFAMSALAVWLGPAFEPAAAQNLMAFELACTAVLTLLLAGWRSYRLKIVSAARDTLRASASPTTPLPRTFALQLAETLRRNKTLATWYGYLTDYLVPGLVILLFLVLLTESVIRLAFDIGDTRGSYCQASSSASGEASDIFDTASLCWNTGIQLEKGARYRITLKTRGDWFDAYQRADVAGRPSSTPVFVLFSPLKRQWLEDWFKPIARIGAKGNDEFALDPLAPFTEHRYENVDASRVKESATSPISDAEAQELMCEQPTPDDHRTLTAEITADASGTLYLYVNDAVLSWPFNVGHFYENNRGTAQVTVEHLHPDGSVRPLRSASPASPTADAQTLRCECPLQRQGTAAAPAAAPAACAPRLD